MRMRDFDGKRLVALARGADYAHTGEEEAIEVVLADVPKDPAQYILDVGCGLGGTAQYIQQHGWGKVTGIDIDEKAIVYAKDKYPGIDFYACNVNDIATVLAAKFAVICLFKSFYAFSDQDKALRAMRKVASDNAQLVIFDSIAYADKNKYANKEFVPRDFTPIFYENIAEKLYATGWRLLNIKQLGDEYARWYANLIQRILDKREAIIKEFGEVAFNYAVETYSKLFANVKAGLLCGVIVVAQAM